MRWNKRRIVGAAIAVTGSVYGAAAALGAPPMMAHTGAHIAVLAPKPGSVITGNVIHARIRVTGMKVSCAYAGTANRKGIGHYHIHLDGSLINMFCGSKASVSLANVKPGRHTLEFVAAEDDHMEDMKTAKKVSFVYKPTHPLTIKPHTFAGKPSISIVSPKNGATVSGGFTLAVRVKNFIPSCALYGKPDVAGYGHWHAFVDTTNGAPMGMGTMLAMSCAKSVHVSLAGIKPGVHKFFAMIEDDAHAPTIKGHTVAELTLHVK